MAGDVLVVAEHRERRLAPATLELVAAGRPLAASLGGSVKVALLGHSVDSLAVQLAGHAEVVLADHPALANYTAGGYEQALRTVRDRVAPRVVLLPHSSQGFDLAPLLAASWDVPVVANAVALASEGSALLVTRRIFNDKVVAILELATDRLAVVTVRPGAGKASAPLDSSASVVRVDVSIDASRVPTRFLAYERPQVQDIDIGAADIVVSAGRGIKEKKNLALVEELARVLGGVVGASRPLTDMDWLPKTRQVGQSGKTVRPKLYIACGISGAMQHISGMKDAGTIVAINTDPSAPIFEVAHYGFTANVLELLPALVKELRGG